MPRKSMKEIRALARKKVEGNDKKNRTYNKDVYPFWNMKENEIATVRFLPDKNKDNDFPFIERFDHWLTIDGKKKKIVCPKTPGFGGTRCPICDLSAQYYAAGDNESGKAYYRQAVHLGRALVLEDPLPPDPDTGETYVGKVVTIQLGYQLYTKFMEDLGNVFDDDDPLPWDLENGFNFNLKKTINKGGKAKWDSSSYFDRKPTPIPDEYLENIELIDLVQLLGEPTTYDQANEMLSQHLGSSTGSIDDDDLGMKRASFSISSGKSSDKSSKRAQMLARLTGGDRDDDDDDDDHTDHDDSNKFDDVPDFDSSGDDSAREGTSVAAADDDDDDDDDLEDLKSILKSRKRS